MSLVGTLSTMPLTDLLQWLATAGKSGTLQVERNRIAKWIVMREGRVIGCSTDDPPQRLGQYLLSRDKIDAEQLRQGLDRQKQTGEHLGRILVEMGAITKDDLAGHLETKAEETIYSVFDWDDGTFRFEDGAGHSQNTFPVDLRVEDVLLRGLKRYDEMRRIRQVFHDPALVLRYTSVPPGPEIFSNKMARTMYSAIDGERSIAEILLHVHGSEYIVFKFLFELHRNGYVEIAGAKSPQAEIAPAATSAPTSRPYAATAADLAPAAPFVASSSPDGAPAAVVDAAPAAVAKAPPVAETRMPGSRSAATAPIESRLAEARNLMDEGSHEAALEILDTLYREHPGDDALRRLTAEAEAAFIDRAYRHLVPADKVPVLTRPVDSLVTESLSPQEFFLLSRIDGSWDIRSIIQVAPLREVDALRTLKRMRELGMIELRDPEE